LATLTLAGRRAGGLACRADDLGGRSASSAGAASPAPAPGSRFTFNGAISSFLEDSFNTRLLVEFPNGLIPLGGVGSGISGPFRGAVDSNNTQLLTFPLFTVSRSAPSSVTIQGRVDDLTAPGTYPICIQVTADNDPDGIDKFTFDFRVKAPPDNFLNPGVHATGGDPVGTYAGNYVEFEPPDLNLGGPLPIFIERYYDSALWPLDECD
jgi:hypothetical protein